MEIVVLAKAVPAVDALRFDPTSRTVRRDTGPLFLNPFDQRALRVALELRRPGERVSVVSLGPPAARPVLREARAVGADRAILICDPVFAGSDTLATATVLAAVLRRLAAELVIAGAWTTDSETGQVGPELAAILDRPVLTAARSIRRLGSGAEFEVVADTATGWVAYRGSPPVVLTVGEKIAKPLKPAAERLQELGEASVELWGSEDVGLPADRVGVRGSATVVESITIAAATRTARQFADGTIPERVGGAVDELARRLGAPRLGAIPLPPATASSRAANEALVLVTGRHGRLDPAALGILVALRLRIPDGWPVALWIGDAPTEEETVLLERAGALAGWLVRAPGPRVEAPSAAAAVDRMLAGRPELAAVAFLADPYGRTVAGLLAGRRRLGLIGDAIDVRLDAQDRWLWTKPSFGRRNLAEIRSDRRPTVATMRPGGFALPDPGGAGGFGWVDVPVPVPPSPWVAFDEGSELDATSELDGRDVLVAVGMGVGGPEAIARLAPMLGRWNAGLTATRRVVDAGWVPRQLQVGLTGRAPAPRLAVLLGVSGSVNHTVGWRRAGTVLAVNRDPDAAVFQDADVGIVGPLEEVLPVLDGALARLLGS